VYSRQVVYLYLKIFDVTKDLSNVEVASGSHKCHIMKSTREVQQVHLLRLVSVQVELWRVTVEAV